MGGMITHLAFTDSNLRILDDIFSSPTAEINSSVKGLSHPLAPNTQNPPLTSNRNPIRDSGGVEVDCRPFPSQPKRIAAWSVSFSRICEGIRSPNGP